jgi:hypothetical protein
MAVLVVAGSGTERAELLMAKDQTDIHINMLR